MSPNHWAHGRQRLAAEAVAPPGRSYRVTTKLVLGTRDEPSPIASSRGVPDEVPLQCLRSRVKDRMAAGEGWAGMDTKVRTSLLRLTILAVVVSVVVVPSCMAHIRATVGTDVWSLALLGLVFLGWVAVGLAWLLASRGRP